MGLRLKPKVGLNVTLMECEGQVDRANPVLLGNPSDTVRRESTEFPKANKMVSLYRMLCAGHCAKWNVSALSLSIVFLVCIKNPISLISCVNYRQLGISKAQCWI